MILDYIYHSGFAIEAEGVTLIIDYYKDSSETELTFPSRPLQPGSTDMERATSGYHLYLLKRHSETPSGTERRCDLY